MLELNPRITNGHQKTILLHATDNTPLEISIVPPVLFVNVTLIVLAALTRAVKSAPSVSALNATVTMSPTAAPAADSEVVTDAPEAKLGGSYAKVKAKLKLTDPLFVVYSKRSPVVGVGAQASMGLAFPSMLYNSK